MIIDESSPMGRKETRALSLALSRNGSAEAPVPWKREKPCTSCVLMRNKNFSCLRSGSGVSPHCFFLSRLLRRRGEKKTMQKRPHPPKGLIAPFEPWQMMQERASQKFEMADYHIKEYRCQERGDARLPGAGSARCPQKYRRLSRRGTIWQSTVYARCFHLER